MSSSEWPVPESLLLLPADQLSGKCQQLVFHFLQPTCHVSALYGNSIDPCSQNGKLIHCVCVWVQYTDLHIRIGARVIYLEFELLYYRAGWRRRIRRKLLAENRSRKRVNGFLGQILSHFCIWDLFTISDEVYVFIFFIVTDRKGSF